MTTGNITINPLLTTTGVGMFAPETTGYVQGVALDDPAIRNELAGGVLSLNESLPMWGGVGIFENIPLANQGVLGGQVGRASTLANLTGFSVFNQAHNGVTSPQSPVPLFASGMTVHFFRLGSGIRIPVAADPALVDIDGQIITAQVSWDFDAQRLIPYRPANAPIAITRQTWSGGLVTVVTSSAHGLNTGDVVGISGAVPIAYNGSVTVTVVNTTTFTYPLAVNPGSNTVPGQLDAGGGALPVRVLEVLTSGSKTVDFDPVTGFATWNNNGAVAIILI